MLRMSNHKKGEWCDIVDGLYWSFIERNIKFFEKNPETLGAFQKHFQPGENTGQEADSNQEADLPEK